jgi:hypothetical protein
LRAVKPKLVALALGLAVVSCGSSAPVIRPSSEFTEEHARVFEDGVDFIALPDTLEGRWEEEWAAEFQQRVGQADFIALVKITTVRTDTDLERRRTYRLVADIDSVLLGESPGEEVSLVTAEGQPGFNSIDENERRLLNAEFVAYVKWYETPEGEVLAHWHLSPNSEGVRRRTQFLIARRRDVPERRTVIRRQN